MIKVRRHVFLTMICFVFCLSSSAAEKISEIIRGNDYDSLKTAFDNEIRHSEEQIKKAKDLEERYPKDSRPHENRLAWEKHISLCEDQFFAVLRELFKPDGSTAIYATTFSGLQAEYRRKASMIDWELGILNGLSEEYPNHDVSGLISALRDLRTKMKNTRYTCQQHQTICNNCISTRESCQACGGDGKWGFWDWTCQLCTGTGSIYAPGKTYCPYCHGRWDEDINCTKCDHGLVPCPSHTVACPFCGTVDGVFFGQTLEQ